MLVGQSLLREERDIEATDCQVALTRRRRSKRNCRGKSPQGILTANATEGRKSLLREEDGRSETIRKVALTRERR